MRQQLSRFRTAFKCQKLRPARVASHTASGNCVSGSDSLGVGVVVVVVSPQSVCLAAPLPPVSGVIHCPGTRKLSLMKLVCVRWSVERRVMFYVLLNCLASAFAA